MGPGEGAESTHCSLEHGVIGLEAAGTFLPKVPVLAIPTTTGREVATHPLPAFGQQQPAACSLSICKHCMCDILVIVGSSMLLAVRMLCEFLDQSHCGTLM